MRVLEASAKRFVIISTRDTSFQELFSCQW